MDRKELRLKLNNEYITKRQKASFVAEQNLNNALKNKEFYNIYIKLNEKLFNLAKIDGIKGKESEIDKLKSEIKGLEEKKSKVLISMGISENDFKPNYECKKCKDTGKIGDKDCTCFTKRIIEELVSSSGLEMSELSDFKDFNSAIARSKEHRETLEKLKNVLIKFVDKFGGTKILNIVLIGKTGVGKTFALECTANEIMKHGYSCCFFSAFGVNNELMKYHTCFDANKQSYLDVLLDPDLLVIDDLGSEPVFKNVTKEYLYLVLSERMLKHKSTLISTNLNQQEIIDRYGERVFSRIFNKSKSLVIKIDGTDLRLSKK